LSDRNQFVGLAGGFGTALLGRHDTPLKMSQGKFDQFGDLPNGDIYTVMPGEDRVDNVIAYVSPAMAGLTLVGAAVSGELGDGATVGADDALTGLADHISIAALYSNGPIFASLAYNSYDLGALADSDPNLLRATFIWNGGMWQAGVMFNSFSLDDLDLGIVDADLAGIEAEDADSWGLSGNLKVGGNGKVKAQYLTGDGPTLNVGDLGFSPGVRVAAGNDGFEVTQWSIGYEHALSKSTTLHAGYTAFEFDDADAEENALFGGIIHNF
jgi:predicted porin